MYMPTQPAGIVVFTKPDCPHCARVKALLDRKSVQYATLDVTRDRRTALASIYLSGKTSVPQVLVSGIPAGGADECEQLDRSGDLDALLQAAVARPVSLELPDSDDELEAATSEITMADVIEGSDGTKSLDPEEIPLLHFYKMFFGWWPNCYHYLHRYPEAYKAFIYSTLMSVAGGQAKELLGEDLLCAVAFATSEAQGCGYCQVHTAATTELSLGLVEEFKAIRAGNPIAGTPRFGELDIVLAELAGAASVNNVTDGLISSIHALRPDDADEYVKAVGQIASVFGFLNCFNDLTGVEIEGGWNARVQSVISVDMRRHAQRDNGTENPTNLDFDLPPATLSFPAMIAKYEAKVGDDLDGYLVSSLGVAPNWMKEWFGPYQKRHAYMYVSLMGRDEPSAKISRELKHLMARVAAIVRGHEYLSAVEGFMAFSASDQSDRAVRRVRECYAAALDLDGDKGPFDQSERAALRLAAASAQIPLVTLQKTMAPVLDHFDQDEIIQLFVVCSVAGSIQRWCAVARPALEPIVEVFCEKFDLPTSTVPYRFPALVSGGR